MYYIFVKRAFDDRNETILLVVSFAIECAHFPSVVLDVLKVDAARGFQNDDYATLYA